MTKRLIGLLLVIVLCFSAVPLIRAEGGSMGNFVMSREYPEGKFADVKDKDWFAKFVKKAYSYSLIDGSSATTYNPTGDVTIAETLVIACNLNKIYFNREIEPAEGAWYARFVNYALANGIIKAGEYSNYQAKATRTQFAAILADALPAEAYPQIVTVEDNAIPDVRVNDEKADKIYLLYRAGILGGNDEEGIFAPKTNIQRSAVATIISNIVDPAARGGRTLKADSIGVTFEEFLANLNTTREEASRHHYTYESAAAYLKDFKNTLNLVSDAEVKALNTPREPIQSVSKSGALSDVDLLFRLLKAFYASYEYFGGDAAYNKAKDAVIQAINNNNSAAVSTDWLARTICRNLAFMIDGHAAIGDYELCDFNNQRPFDYYVKGLYFYLDDGGYYTRVNKAKAYLSAVGTDQNVADYLRVSVDDAGRLCYILSISEVRNGSKLKIKSIQLNAKGQSSARSIAWTQFQIRDWSRSAWYNTISLHDGIPYVAISNMDNTGQRDDELEKTFLSMHSLTGTQDVVIYNILTTGSGRYAVCGENIPIGNEMSNYKVSNVLIWSGKRNYPQETPVGQYAIRNFKANWQADDTLKFILQDYHNGSAHEDYLSGLKSVENTVFVGGRSSGKQITGGNHAFYLPNSHLIARFGMFLGFQNNGSTENFDAIGHEPDIWISAEDAADALYRLCKFYGIENGADLSKIRTAPYYSDYTVIRSTEHSIENPRAHLEY